MIVEFCKYQGTGNDFILIDNREGKLNHLSQSQIAKICDRRFGIGADGLILLNTHPQYDFEMKNTNSDGYPTKSMCGNGARSIIAFANELGIQKDHYRFLAADGEHEATIDFSADFSSDFSENSGPLIHVKMKPVTSIQVTESGSILNTGSPHFVQFVQDLVHYPVMMEGKKIRHSNQFSPAGINVNFIESIHDQLFIRTFERGVEDETLSCGTGVIAAALVTASSSSKNQSVNIQTRGGPLRVRFEKKNMQSFSNIWLIGPAVKTFTGVFDFRKFE